MSNAVIIGGGPAGCSVAIWLRRAGRRVTIVDRAQFPRDKPCGEGMLPAGVAALSALGLGDTLTRLGAPMLHAIEFVSNGRYARGTLPSPGAGLDRRRFDAIMSQAARDAGVCWIEGTPTGLRRDGDGRVCGVVLADGTKLDAAVTVGADGLRSWTRQALGLNAPRTAVPRFGLCVRVELPRETGQHVEVHLVPNVGELYVTPTAPRQISLALLAPRHCVRMLRGSLANAVDAAVERSPALGRRLADAVALGNPLATGPLASRAARIWAPGALLAGDAALAIDPIGGDGMTLALTGSHACATAAAALADGAPASVAGGAYAQNLRNASLRRRAFVAGLLALASRPRLARSVIAGLSLCPAAVAALCALHEGTLLNGRAAAG